MKLKNLALGRQFSRTEKYESKNCKCCRMVSEKLHLPTKTVLLKLFEDLVPRTTSFIFLSADCVVYVMLGDLLATLEQEWGNTAVLFTSCVIIKILMKILTNMP